MQYRKSILNHVYGCLLSFTGFVLSLWIGGPAAHAELSLEGGPVVKVYSGRCGSTLDSIGSGFLFEEKGNIFVLTSEHVIFTSSIEKDCHEGRLSTGGKKVRLELIQKDWTSGLALLQVEPKGLKEEWRTYAESLIALEAANRSDRQLTLNEVTVAVGFPKESKQLVRPSAKVLLSNSNRSIILRTESMIEVWDLWAEPGMSGGALQNERSEFLL